MSKKYTKNYVSESLNIYDPGIKLFDEYIEDNSTVLFYTIPKKAVKYELFEYLINTMPRYELFMNIMHEIVLKVWVEITPGTDY